MSYRPRRSVAVLAMVDALRELHPELSRPLTIASLRDVLAREHIPVLRRPIHALAYVEGGLGAYIIMLRAGIPTRIERRVLAHEYAHIKLHFGEPVGIVVYQHGACVRGDPRESEALLFTRLLEVGPEATPQHPRIAPLIAAIDGPAVSRRPGAQLALPLPEDIPLPRAPRPRPQPTGRKLPPSDIRRAVSHDALLFDWSKGGKPLGYFYAPVGKIEVWDAEVTERDGRRRSVVVPCGDARATTRLFVLAPDDRRRYVFSAGERPDRSPRALDRQIAAAVRVPMQSGSAIARHHSVEG